MFKVSSIQYIYSRLHGGEGELLVSGNFTLNHLHLESHQRLLICVAFLPPPVPFLGAAAASPALLTAQLPSALLQFVLLALRSLGLAPQIAHHGPQGFKPVQPVALGRLEPDL